MKLQSTWHGKTLVAQLNGEIDTMDHEGFNEALVEVARSQPEGVVLDFSGVTYIASVGISMLLQLARDLRKRGSKVAIAAVTPPVQLVLEAVRLGAVIPLEATLEGALAKVRSNGKLAEQKV